MNVPCTLSPSLLRPMPTISMFTGKVMTGGNAPCHSKQEVVGHAGQKAVDEEGFRTLLATSCTACQLDIVKMISKRMNVPRTLTGLSLLCPVPTISMFTSPLETRGDGSRSSWPKAVDKEGFRTLLVVFCRDNENDNKEDECALYAQPLLCILCQHPCSQGGGGQKHPSSLETRGDESHWPKSGQQ